MEAEHPARIAILNFYGALEGLLQGHGTSAMEDAWHHIDEATLVHPYGHWARGWREVYATWQEVGSIFSHYQGHRGRSEGIGDIHDLHVYVVGDSAHSVGHYRSTVHFADGTRQLNVNCTNIATCRAGVWKVIHHHPDQATPEFQEALGRMVTGT